MYGIFHTLVGKVGLKKSFSKIKINSLKSNLQPWPQKFAHLSLNCCYEAFWINLILFMFKYQFDIWRWMKSSIPSFKVTECIFTLLTKLKEIIVILLVAHPESVGMCWKCCFFRLNVSKKGVVLLYEESFWLIELIV